MQALTSAFIAGMLAIVAMRSSVVRADYLEGGYAAYCETPYGPPSDLLYICFHSASGEPSWASEDLQNAQIFKRATDGSNFVVVFDGKDPSAQFDINGRKGNVVLNDDGSMKYFIEPGTTGIHFGSADPVEI